MFRHGIVKSWLNSRGLAVGVLVLVVIGIRPAYGHQASMTHSTVDIDRGQQELSYIIKFDPPDVAEALGLAIDQDPSESDVAAGSSRLFDYVLERISVKSGEESCPAERIGVRLVSQGGRFVELRWKVRCPEPIETLIIEYNLFFDLDSLHRGLLQVNYRDEYAFVELKSGAARFEWTLSEPPPSNWLGFVRSGIDHIVFGFDHIGFLLGLLLVVVIVRNPSAGDDEAPWTTRRFGSGLRYTATIVTSFTVAHSLTLIAASLDWISLDSRLVESVIAASIVYVAVENVLVPDTRFRYLVTFLFGLVHGLGFAAMLKVLLPPENVILPLLMFNVGVEVGQLVIVVAALPILGAIARALGASRYRDLCLPVLSGVLALLGTVWFIERAFDTVILGL